MADAQAVAGWVGKEIQAIEGFFSARVGCLIEAGFDPAFLPPGFDVVRVIAFYRVSPIEFFLLGHLFDFNSQYTMLRTLMHGKS
jgi:hypothetical protein